MADGESREYEISKSLYSALQNEDKRFAAILLEYHGADPNLLLPDESGVAPVHYASGLGHEFVELLLKFGANPNLRSSDWSTPLHIAALWGDHETVQLLLQNGADPSLTDENGETPIELAEQNDHFTTCALLEECSSSVDKDGLKPRYSMQLKHVHRFFPSPLSSLNVSPNEEEFSCANETTSDRPIPDFSSSTSIFSEPSEESKENSIPETPTRGRARLTHSKSTSSLGLAPNSYTRCEIGTPTKSLERSVSSPRPFDAHTPDRSNWMHIDTNSPSRGWKKRPMAREKCRLRKALNYSLQKQKSLPIDTTYSLHSESDSRTDERYIMCGESREEIRDRVISSNLTSPLQTVTTPPTDETKKRTLPRTVSYGQQPSNIKPSLPKTRSCSALEDPPSSSSLEFNESLRDFVESEAECLDATWDLSDGLNTTKTLSKQFEKLLFQDKGSPRRIDVTSPDHPFIEMKETDGLQMNETCLESADSNAQAFESCTSKLLSIDGSGESKFSDDASFRSVGSVMEFEYKDTETGQSLIERRFPSLLSLQESLDSLDGRQSISSVLSEVGHLDDAKLREKLRDLGQEPGPITNDTRRLYKKQLTKLIRHPDRALKTKTVARTKDYTQELRLALRGDVLPDLTKFDVELADCFSAPDRQWREGKLKSSFNYILLDPAVSRNLPLRADELDEVEIFKTFIDAVFYIGKGKRSRPLCHFYEALSQLKNPKTKVSEKVARILRIWSEGNGVISLHCYQNTIPVEAYTREACMIDAMGITNLTNVKRGDYYGLASTWSPRLRKQVGVRLLKRACHILLYEGERQIRPGDVG